MRFMTLGLVLGMMAGVVQVQADEPRETYFKLEGGAAISGRSEFEEAPFLDTDLDTGWTAALGIGRRFTRNIRGEIEASYTAQDFDPADNGFYTGGELQAATLMALAFWDFNVDGNFRPFIGGGAGIGIIEPDAGLELFGPSAEPLRQRQETSIAWQATAGAVFDVSQSLALSVRYRYLDAGRYLIGDFEGDYDSHQVLGGLRYTFGGHREEVRTPPPPPPAPEPAPAPDCSDEIVYFDFDEASIRPDAEPALDRAAGKISTCGPEVVIVEGHTDTKGSKRYNEGLSRRRAEAVRAALIARGVDGGLIRIEALGETENAVDCGDNCKEQENRRAVVIIRVG